MTMHECVVNFEIGERSVVLRRSSVEDGIGVFWQLIHIRDTDEYILEFPPVVLLTTDKVLYWTNL